MAVKGDLITYQFVSLKEIDDIIESTSPIMGTFMELLEDYNCCLTGDRPLLYRIDELFGKPTRQKDIIISSKSTEADKTYNAKRSMSTHTDKQQEKDEKEAIDKIISNKYIKYLASFILFNRDIPYVFTKELLQLSDDCDALKRCESPREIAQIINGEIFNITVWEYIIVNKLTKDNLNDINECILSLIELLNTIDSTKFWLISRIDINGKERFLKDIQTFKPELYNTFKSIKIPEDKLKNIFDKKKK